MTQTRLSRTDGQVGTNFRLDRDLVMRLAKPAPGRLILQTAIEWACIGILMALASWASSIPVSLLCMVMIATRQHALLALMHDYSHYQLSRKHALLNDLIGDALTAFPFFITLHGFRRSHLPHHRCAGTDEDANWLASIKKNAFCFPKTRRQLAAEILKHCVGWYTLADLKGYTLDAGMAMALPTATRIWRASVALAIAVGASCFGLWPTLLLYWILPLATFLMAILYLRDIGEHFGLPALGVAGARTVLAGRLERLLICQNGVNFHTEHHLFPSVPFCRLQQLHDALCAHPDYRTHAVITHGYLTGLVREVTALPRRAQ